MKELKRKTKTPAVQAAGEKPSFLKRAYEEYPMIKKWASMYILKADWKSAKAKKIPSG